MRRLSIIVTESNHYFSHWASGLIMGIDGYRDDVFSSEPQFTKDYQYAHVYENERDAEKARQKMWGFLGKTAVVTSEVEEDLNCEDWIWNTCFEHGRFKAFEKSDNIININGLTKECPVCNFEYTIKNNDRDDE